MTTLNRFWWQFRFWLCEPFGHVLYFPRSWKFWSRPWQCACRDIQIGGRWSGPDFRRSWNRMRRPSIGCDQCWSASGVNPSCACKGREWVRV